jgi:hypothetical protein
MCVARFGADLAQLRPDGVLLRFRQRVRVPVHELPGSVLAAEDLGHAGFIRARSAAQVRHRVLVADPVADVSAGGRAGSRRVVLPGSNIGASDW